MKLIPARWIAIAIFVLSSLLNYLDRQLLAAAAPMIKAEFHWTNAEFGLLLLGFSVAYAVSAPFAGLFIDRVGLNKGIGVSLAAWSAAGMTTGLSTGFASLFATRTALGAAQAAGVPAFGKANSLYLAPEEFALGTAVNQTGLSIGGVLAPLLVGFFAVPFGWRGVFVICGLAGFIWIPLWLFTAARVPKREVKQDARPVAIGGMLRDRRFWALVIANILYMTMYTLWTNWTTVYFVQARGMTAEAANRSFAWIPPVFATLGGFAGGAIAFRLIRSGIGVFKARMTANLLAAVLLLSTAAIPLMPTAYWAAAAICFSYFWVTVMSGNIYAMPIDIFGPQRAAFGVAALTCAYGVMQAVVSPAIGKMIDEFGFSSVCVVLAPFPLAAVGVLYAMARPPAESPQP